MICATNYPFPVLFANKAFTELTGFEQHEVVGRNMRCLQGPMTNENIVREMMEDMRATGWGQCEVVNYTKDNKPYIAKIEIIPVESKSYDEGYYISHYFGSIVRTAELESDGAIDTAGNERNLLLANFNATGKSIDSLENTSKKKKPSITSLTSKAAMQEHQSKLREERRIAAANSLMAKSSDGASLRRDSSSSSSTCLPRLNKIGRKHSITSGGDGDAHSRSSETNSGSVNSNHSYNSSQKSNDDLSDIQDSSSNGSKKGEKGSKMKRTKSQSIRSTNSSTSGVTAVEDATLSGRSSNDSGNGSLNGGKVEEDGQWDSNSGSDNLQGGSDKLSDAVTDDGQDSNSSDGSVKGNQMHKKDKKLNLPSHSINALVNSNDENTNMKVLLMREVGTTTTGQGQDSTPLSRLSSSVAAVTSAFAEATEMYGNDPNIWRLGGSVSLAASQMAEEEAKITKEIATRNGLSMLPMETFNFTRSDTKMESDLKQILGTTTSGLLGLNNFTQAKSNSLSGAHSERDWVPKRNTLENSIKFSNPMNKRMKVSDTANCTNNPLSGMGLLEAFPSGVAIHKSGEM